jgi:hypothetical protein
MSTDGAESGDKKEEVKVHILEVLSVPIQVPVSTTPSEEIDPVPHLNAIEGRYEKAKSKIIDACTRMAEGKVSFDVANYCPKATEAQWNVRRYFPALNRKEKLTGKEAKIFRTALDKATINVISLEKLADDTRLEAKKKIVDRMGDASKEVDDQQLVVKSLTEKEAEANRKLKTLRTTVAKNESNIKTRDVNKESLLHAKSSPHVIGLKAKKTKTKEESDELISWQKVIDLEETFNTYTNDLAAATLKKSDAEKLKATKQQVLDQLKANEKKRTDPYNAEKLLTTKSIDLLLASGACFPSLVIPDFKSSCDAIDQETQLYGEYENGILELKSLQSTIAPKHLELQLLVTEEAKIANQELALVADPEDIASDPVRKKLVDSARELIAKRLKDPLVGTAVIAARSEISAFAIFVQSIRDELDGRADQVITCQRLKLVYGEQFSNIGVATTGTGVLSFFDTTENVAIQLTSVLNAGTHSVQIIAAANADFKKMEKPFQVVVDKDKTTIVWRDPVPILRNSSLTPATLSAKLKSSSGEVLAILPTFNPPLNRAMPNVREETLKASFGGNENYLAATDKTVTIKVVANLTQLGTEAMMTGRAFKEPTLQKHKDLLEKWHTDDSPKGLKATSIEVMNAIKEMNPAELIDYMNDFIINGNGAGGKFTPQGTGDNLNMIWYLENGLQVRYKPAGKLRPPPINQRAPMFSIEGKTRNDPDNEPSRRGVEEDVAFKLTLGLKPGAYGPDQTILPPGVSSNSQSQNYKLFMDAACATTHLKCKPKVEQVITWENPPDITEGDPLGEASLKPQSQEPSALVFTLDTDEVITKDKVLPAGKQQTLRVKAKETLKYLASANFVEVKINVKKVQSVTWNPPKEIPAGIPIGDKVLNAVRQDDAVLSYFFFHEGTDKPMDENTVLPEGKNLTLKLLVAATDNYHAVIVPVTATIDVNRQEQTVTWIPTTSELTEGSELGDSLFNATASSGLQPEYFFGTDLIDATTVLPVGVHELKAIAKETDQYLASEPASVSIHVKANEESI